MVTERIDILANAIRDTLWATGAFQSGTPYVPKEVGPDRPTFHVWWDGFNAGQEMRSDPGPSVATHRFEVDLYVSLSSDAQESQRQLWRLAAITIGALKADQRFGGKCVRSRVTSGNAAFFLEGNPMLGLALILEADCMSF